MIAAAIRRLAPAIVASACLCWAPSVASECGRCFSRCIDACNQIRAACDDRCVLDCASLFPEDPAAYAACREICHGQCLALEQECKQLCKVFKDPIPTEP